MINLKIGMIFKNQWGLYEIISGFGIKGKRKKPITVKFGEHVLNRTMIDLEHMSASKALERIMDICGIDQDGKFQIRSKINLFARPTKGNIPK